MQQAHLQRFNRSIQHVEDAATVRVVGGRYWLVFTPAAIRTFKLRRGQRFKVIDVNIGSITMIRKLIR
jgi:hypothetical protein